MPYFQLGMDKKLIVPYADYMNAMKPDFEYIGDTAEIIDLVRCLYLPSANSVKLVGARGAGSTVLMDALVHHQTSDFMPDDFMIRPIFKLNGNSLFSTADNTAIENRFHDAMEDMQRQFRQRKAKPILVIDDGCTFADNAPQHVINSLVEAAVRADYVDLVVGVEKKKEDEFNAKHIEFVTSFTTKEIKEPGPEQILKILEHHAAKHTAHGVSANREALEHVMEITERFKSMYNTAQPNRAIRLLDSSATAFRIDIHSRAPGSYELEKSLEDTTLKIASGKIEGDELESLQSDAETLKIELNEANQEWNTHRDKIKHLQSEIREFDVMIATSQQEIEKLDQQTKEKNYNDALQFMKGVDENDPELKGRAKKDVLNLGMDDFLDFVEFDLLVHRNPRVKELVAQISRYTEATDKKQSELAGMSDHMHKAVLMPTSVIDDVATDVTKTPVGGVSGRLRENLRNGVALMQESVFGQDHIIEPMVKSLQRASAGLNDENRPLGAFMIAGPPGTGKTWTAEQLAVKLFGSKDYYVELNMNDYMEKHTISTLIGAPPGYSGYGQKGKLVEIGQEKPFCVLCLDEIEKAHPDIRQALLVAKGKGFLRGLDGEEADFRNVIFVETSNFANDKGIWSGSYEDGVEQFHKILRSSGDVFSPEYLDRNDQILCAGPLDEDALVKIVAQEIATLQKKAQRRHPELNIDVSDSSVSSFVADHCVGTSGRRSEMIVNKMIGDHLTGIMLSGVETAGTLKAEYNADKQRFDFDFVQHSLEKKVNPSVEFSQQVSPV